MPNQPKYLQIFGIIAHEGMGPKWDIDDDRAGQEELHVKN